MARSGKRRRSDHDPPVKSPEDEKLDSTLPEAFNDVEMFNLIEESKPEETQDTATQQQSARDAESPHSGNGVKTDGTDTAGSTGHHWGYMKSLLKIVLRQGPHMNLLLQPIDLEKYPDYYDLHRDSDLPSDLSDIVTRVNTGEYGEDFHRFETDITRLLLSRIHFFSRQDPESIEHNEAAKLVLGVFQRLVGSIKRKARFVGFVEMNGTNGGHHDVSMTDENTRDDVSLQDTVDVELEADGNDETDFVNLFSLPRTASKHLPHLHQQGEPCDGGLTYAAAQRALLRGICLLFREKGVESVSSTALDRLTEMVEKRTESIGRLWAKLREEHQRKRHKALSDGDAINHMMDGGAIPEWLELQTVGMWDDEELEIAEAEHQEEAVEEPKEAESSADLQGDFVDLTGDPVATNDPTVEDVGEIVDISGLDPPEIHESPEEIINVTG
eukprot:Clim_evm3s209 gene=Clim_evmTU3s209